MPQIRFIDVTKRWGKSRSIEKFNLTIEDNAFVTLLGPSGCGKTAILKMLAGLKKPTSGTIAITEKSGVPVNAKQSIGFFFNNYELNPRLSVYDNIAKSLKRSKKSVPLFDFAAKQYSDIARILESNDELFRILKDCEDNGKLDAETAVLKIERAFKVSQFTAKKIISFKSLVFSENCDDLTRQAQELKSEYEEKLEELAIRRKAKGQSLGKDFKILKNGAEITKKRKLSKEEIDLAIQHVSRTLRLWQVMRLRPGELSKGQLQLVALGMVLAQKPRVIVLDDTFSKLDAKLRAQMQQELKNFQRDTESTIVYATNDQIEAMTLSTKICVLKNGIVQQYDAPMEIYNRPKNLFVADFIGNPPINFIDATGSQDPDGIISFTLFEKRKICARASDGFSLENWYKEHGTASGKIPEDTFVIGVRPEFIQITKDGIFEGEISEVFSTGMMTSIKITIDDMFVTSAVYGSTFPIGKKVRFNFSGENILLFDRKTGRLITNLAIENYRRF